MQKLFTFFVAIFLTASVFAQAPEKMSYQAVIRNSNNQLVPNETIGMQVSILQGSENGIPIYTETHTPRTNDNGLVSIEVGAGTTNNDFTTINWEKGPFFIKTETDLTGGINYTITGTSQLLSVPFALHSKTTEALSDVTIKNDTLILTKDNKIKIPSLAISNIDFSLYQEGLSFSKVAPFLIGHSESSSFPLHDHRMIINSTNSEELNSGLLIISDSTEWDQAPLKINLDYRDSKFKGEKFLQFGVSTSEGYTHWFFGLDENRDLFLSPQIGYRHFTFNRFGRFGVNTQTPKSRVHVHDGDVYIDNPEKGIILSKPDGTGCYRITIDNNGDFVKAPIACPE